EGLRRSDVVAPRARIAQPRVLHDVLRLAGAAEHAIRDAEQPRPVGLEGISSHRNNPSCTVGYAGRQPSSSHAFAFESGRRIDVTRARYGAMRRGSHAGTVKGFGAPVDSARRRTTSVMLTGSSSTIS